MQKARNTEESGRLKSLILMADIEQEHQAGDNRGLQVLKQGLENKVGRSWAKLEVMVN